MSTLSKLAVLAVVLGMFFRVYQPLTRLSYGHDSDLASWIIKDIVIDGHPRLIGQLTSQPGVFIGSLTYYAQIPGYWLMRFDPVGNLFWSWIVSLTSLISIFAVSYKLYGKRVALVILLMFAVSFDISITERVAVPTALVFIWLTWFYYFLYRLYSGYAKSLYGLAILFSLVWHISLGLGLLFPLVVLGVLIDIKKLQLKHVFGSLFAGLLLLAPLILFEVKHHFQQTAALLTSGHVPFTLDRFMHTLNYMARNMNETYWKSPGGLADWVLPILLVVSVMYLSWRKIFSKTWALMIVVWFGLILVFFSVSKLNLSEYYLHGLNIVWIMTFGIVLAMLPKKIIVAVLAIVVTINLFRLLTFTPNHSGYIEKKNITAMIAKDARQHNYPCVAVSYITDPGNNLGYRYFFYLLNLHVNLPASKSPVYSVVFPQSIVDHLDYSAGAIGLIFPDYSRYTSAAVQQSCLGADENIVGPMFGFSK